MTKETHIAVNKIAGDVAIALNALALHPATLSELVEKADKEFGAKSPKWQESKAGLREDDLINDLAEVADHARNASDHLMLAAETLDKIKAKAPRGTFV